MSYSTVTSWFNVFKRFNELTWATGKRELSVNIAAAPVWTNIAVNATGQASVSGNALVPKTPEAFTYDADGNLTQDGLWSYTWDGENRLVAVESIWGVAEEGRRRLEFRYDAQGRRVEKVVYAWDAQQCSYVPQSTNRFQYEGWNLVAVLDQNNTPLLSFVWGTDLSGSLQGAGGVGGLVSIPPRGGLRGARPMTALPRGALPR